MCPETLVDRDETITTNSIPISRPKDRLCFRGSSVRSVFFFFFTLERELTEFDFHSILTTP